MFVPVFLSLLHGLVPDPVIRILRYVPTVVILDLLRTASAAVIPLGQTLLRLAWLAAWAGGGLLLVAWVVRRQDRQPGRSPAVDMMEESSVTPILDAVSRWITATFRASRRPQERGVGEWRAPEAGVVPYAPASEGEGGGRSGLRIVWAVAAKDIGGLWKNKLALSIFIGTAMVMVTSSVLPLLLKLRATPVMIAYDQGRSTILRALAADDDLRVGIVDSMEELEEVVGGASELMLGLVVPESFDRQAGGAEAIDLDAYVVHWADPAKVSGYVTFFQEQLSTSAWGEVQINVAQQRIYPSAELQGQNFMFALTFTIVLLTMGIALVPLLMVEERREHTLDVLLVSPARIHEVVSGKALAGAVYCLLAAVVVFLFNGYLIVHWGVAILTVLLGAAFAVGIGLLVGVLSDSPSALSLWGALVLFVVLGLAILNLIPDLGLPPVADTLLELAPTSALTGLLGYSLTNEIQLAQVGANLAALFAGTLAVFGLLAWRLRLADR
jgi:ABC-type transport system involved in multi-copper enzyme maturation permease subunit